MEIWTVETNEEGKIELTAPNGLFLFAVSPDTAEMIANMLQDEVDDIRTLDE